MVNLSRSLTQKHFGFRLNGTSADFIHSAQRGDTVAEVINVLK